MASTRYSIPGFIRHGADWFSYEIANILKLSIPILFILSNSLLSLIGFSIARLTPYQKLAPINVYGQSWTNVWLSYIFINSEAYIFFNYIYYYTLAYIVIQK